MSCGCSKSNNTDTTQLKELMSKVASDIKSISDRVDELISTEKPSKCESIIDKIPSCQNFVESRRWSTCKAHQIMENEKILWQQAMDKAWDKLKKTCEWN
jgi:hypothetical protein